MLQTENRNKKKKDFLQNRNIKLLSLNRIKTRSSATAEIVHVGGRYTVQSLKVTDVGTS